jgi:pilus assembly protein CpaD
MSVTWHLSPRCVRRSIVGTMAVAVVLGVGGCRLLDDETARFLSEPTERHAIGLAKRWTSLHVEAGGSGRLSSNQSADVAGFVHSYREQGTGVLRVSLPQSSAGRAATGHLARQIRAIALEVGVAPERIVSGRHEARRGEPPAVVVSFVRPVAVAPECGDWSADLGRDHERIRYPQFGCAVQRNLALNVANARDLIGPQEETPTSSEHRYVSWTKYVGSPVAPGDTTTTAASAGKKPPKNPAPPAPSPQ